MAQRFWKADEPETGTSKGLRSMGSATDILSMSGKSARASLPHANPPPSYVSTSEAEKLIYAEIDQPVNVTEGALYMLNGFLDQILYDILSKSHSTALPAIRSAVPIVLKPRLGRAAVKAADEELQDYLEEEEMEELQNTVGVLDPRAEFDVDLAWKLTRLRCMVYAKLGDMEEEDEEEYLEDDDLRDHISGVKESYRRSANIQPPSAIFLSTVLEFLAEQAMCIAAQHARKRTTVWSKDPNRETLAKQHHSKQDGIIMDEIDMSGVGKEGPLIRLWRSWKGSVRTGGGSMSSRPTTPSIMSPISPDSPSQEWKFPSPAPISTIQEERSPSIRPTSSPSPADIPLPTTDNDVEEIEVPGLARTFEEDEEEPNHDQRPTLANRRPSSMLFMPGRFPDSLTAAIPNETVERPSWTRRRSQSVPPLGKIVLGVRVGDAGKRELSPPIFPRAVEDAVQQPNALKQVENNASYLPQEQSGSNLRSSAISSTVATIAGALSVEASRAFRRDRTPLNQTSPGAPTSAIDTRPSINTADDFDRMHLPLRASTAEMDAIDPGAVDSAGEPEDLALSSADERDGVDNNQRNPRDSGFAVVPTDDEVRAHNATAAAIVQDRSTVHHSHVDDELGQEQPAVGSSRSGATSGYATVYQDPSISNSVGTAVQAGVHSHEPRTIPTVAKSNTSGAATTSAWPVVVPNRRSSLEQQTPPRSPTETRYTQHLPSSHRPPGSEKTSDYHQERVPRYAASGLAASPNGAGGSNWAHNAHSRSGSTKDGRPSTAGSATARRQHIRLRADNEDGAWPSEELDRAKKSLDVLIDSDETLHYTLTPATAREVSSISYEDLTQLTITQASKKPKSQTQELADFFRNTGPPGDEPSRPKSSRSAKEALSGLRPNPPLSPRLPQSPRIPLPINVKTSQPQSTAQQPASSPITPSKPRNPLGEPRDPRTERNTTRDLADYARSTGPENEMQLPKPLGTRPTTAQDTRTRESLREQALGSEGDRRPSTTTGKSTNRLKYQARDARATRTAESSDLIDFIREGPPRAPGEHRIDRHVAPFRTTMDSDDFNALAPPPELDANGRNSDGSAQESAMTIKSMQSSMNSRTGLLDSTNRGAGKFTNGVGSSANAISRQVIPEGDGMPKKTRARVRDPYAIDYSDEEDDMEESVFQPQRRHEEESLVDFLRNTAPTPSMTTLPILGASPNPAQPEASSIIKRSGSASKLKDYLQGSSSGKHEAASKPANGARPESPHLTQVGSKMDKYRPTQPTHAAHVERNRQKMRAEPRDPTTSNGSGTADLAAYLKSSGPPPGMEAPPPQRLVNTKDQAGFMKFFQKRASVKK